MSPIESTRLIQVEVDYEGIDISIVISKEALSKILTRKGVVSSNPGEDIPKISSKKRGSAPKIGPKIGAIKTTPSGKKKLVRYDFNTPRLKGRRRVSCPDTGKKGFPIWETVK